VVEIAKSASLQPSGFEIVHMQRREREQLTDELLGEAVLALLKEKGPISIKILIGRLKHMARTEQDSVRREALKEIITEISAHPVASDLKKSEFTAQQPTNNVYSLFSHTRAVSSGKKH
jgi:probable RcsB/C two-component-system connector